MIKKTLLAVGFLLVLLPTRAQENLHLHLTDGSVLTGYISRQKPGEAITFASDSAVVILGASAADTLPSRRVRSIVDHRIRLADLPAAWRSWAARHAESVVGRGDDAALLLSDIVLCDDSTIGQVRILERGAKVKYLELAPNSYTLTMDRIAVIKADRRPRELLSGVDRRYKLRSGMEYEGQYVEEVPGKTLSLYQRDGVIRVFARDEVLRDNRVKINPDLSLFEQSSLVDIVQLRDGSSRRGIIIERNYSDSDTITSDYLLIQSERGEIHSVDLADVVEYRKERNPSYRRVTDVLLAEGESRINRMRVTARTAQDLSAVIIVDTDSVGVVVPACDPETEIVLESHPADASSATGMKLLQVRSYYDRKEKRTVRGFTYEDLVKEAISPRESTTSINGTQRCVYAVSREGLYAFYDPGTRRTLLFEVKR